MESIVLSQEMQTRYIINSLTGRLERVLTMARDTGASVDLIGCKLGPDAEYTLRKYYGTVNMCNSGDQYLNSVLQNNCRWYRDSYEDYNELDLRDIKSIDVFLRLSKELPDKAKYKPIVNMSKILDKVTVILLILARPDIELDIRAFSSDIFDYVRDAWRMSSKHHERYYELCAPDVTVVSMTEDERYGHPSYGFYKEEFFVRKRQVLPYAFGNVKIIKMDGSGIDQEWEGVVTKCLDAFQESYIDKKPGKVLRNLLTFRGEEY